MSTTEAFDRVELLATLDRIDGRWVHSDGSPLTMEEELLIIAPTVDDLYFARCEAVSAIATEREDENVALCNEVDRLGQELRDLRSELVDLGFDTAAALGSAGVDIDGLATVLARYLFD